MGKVTGFLEFDRQEQKYQLAGDRIRHFREFTLPLDEKDVGRQAARCMDCGVPYCHSGTGCPVNNQIPDWNDLIYQQNWEEASRNLHSTNNFPEFTGRICPAPCEEACTLNLEDMPVTIKTIEQSIADKAWAEGWVRPEPPAFRTGKRVAIVGSGPAGMAAAQQLARVGHDVHLFEREPRAGGLLRYGIPDFKMEKRHIDRRVAQMEQEGVTFHYGVNVGVTKPFEELTAEFDAVLLAGGAEDPRDPKLPGQDLAGVHFAMPYLVQQNRRVGQEEPTPEAPILAGGKHVVVIGGGDTGSDCIGTSNRHGAASVTQLEIMPQPGEDRPSAQPWPTYPMLFRVSSAHEEGGERMYSVSTQEFLGDDEGRVRALRLVDVEFKDGTFLEVEGTQREIPAELVLFAMGFTGPERDGIVEQLEVDLDQRGNVARDDAYMTSVPGVFVAGDAGRGQSLIVWAIAEGRAAAAAVDTYLTGSTTLHAPIPPTERPLVV
jgi:glutamate synthase (NADPH) small chain